MKKFIFLLIAVILCVALTACGGSKKADPLQSIWAVKYNDGRSQIMFSFENVGKTDSGDLDICIWDYDDEEGGLVQTANYIGSYTADLSAKSFVLVYKGESYDFTYDMVEGESLTITSGSNVFGALVDAYGSSVFELDYIRANEAN